MNLAGARAAIARNKVPVAIVGALAVVVIGLRARSKGTADTAPVTSSSSSTSPLSKYPAFYTAGNGTYDSTGTDVYNALQDEIQALGDRLQANQQTTATPVPELPAWLTPSDPRRQAIVADYNDIFGRQADLGGLNYWDANGGSLDQVRQRMLAEYAKGSR